MWNCSSPHQIALHVEWAALDYTSLYAGVKSIGWPWQGQLWCSSRTKQPRSICLGMSRDNASFLMRAWAGLRACLLYSVTVHSVRVGLARPRAARQQVVDVRQAFARGQAQQVAIVVDRPGEQRAEDVYCALGTVGRQSSAQPPRSWPWARRSSRAWRQ